jgi:hypothetical protein
MIFEAVIKEAFERAFKALDDMVTKDNAEKLLIKLDEIENHKLLQEDRCFILVKVDGEIQLNITEAFNINFEAEPQVIVLSDVLDMIRAKCYRALGKPNPKGEAPEAPRGIEGS